MAIRQALDSEENHSSIYHSTETKYEATTTPRFGANYPQHSRTQKTSHDDPQLFWDPDTATE